MLVLIGLSLAHLDLTVGDLGNGLLLGKGVGANGGSEHEGGGEAHLEDESVVVVEDGVDDGSADGDAASADGSSRARDCESGV